MALFKLADLTGERRYEALAKFFHEMGGEPAPQPKLSVSISTLPEETTTVVLESRGKA